MATKLHSHVKQLLIYDYWANELIAQTLIKHNVTDEKLSYWISHMINAERVWLERIAGSPNETSPHTVYPLKEIPAMLSQIHSDLIDWLEEQDDDSLSKLIEYTNTKGTPFQNEIIDILAHLINHSTHHRAQIVAKLREMNIPPPATDYIFYMREAL